MQHAAVEHGDAIGQAHRFLLVVGDMDHRVAGALQQGAQFGPQLVAQLGIEVAHRLIQQHQPRLAQQGPGQGHPLALAAGELGRAPQLQPLQLQQGQHLGDALAPFGRYHAAHLQPQLQVAQHAQVRIERVALEHHRHLALAGGALGHVLAIENDAAGAGGIEPGQQAQGGGFAAAAWAEQRQAFPRCHRKAEAIEQQAIAHLAAQLIAMQTRCGHPFTAPWVSPLTICRWNTSTRASSGRPPSTVAAAKAP